MNMIPVTSSTIAEIGHDADSKEMRVKFKSGKTYSFGNVEAHQFDAFRSAESHGKHFHQFFRGNPKHAMPQS